MTTYYSCVEIDGVETISMRELSPSQVKALAESILRDGLCISVFYDVEMPLHTNVGFSCLYQNGANMELRRYVFFAGNKNAVRRMFHVIRHIARH